MVGPFGLMPEEKTRYVFSPWIQKKSSPFLYVEIEKTLREYGDNLCGLNRNINCYQSANALPMIKGAC